MSHLPMQCIVQRISANINDVNKINIVTVKVFQPWYWCRPTVQWGSQSAFLCLQISTHCSMLYYTVCFITGTKGWHGIGSNDASARNTFLQAISTTEQGVGLLYVWGLLSIDAEVGGRSQGQSQVWICMQCMHQQHDSPVIVDHRLKCPQAELPHIET